MNDELYRDWILTPGNPDGTGAGTPPWLLDPAGAAFLQALGAGLDDNVQRMREAVKASFPALGPADALPVTGDEVGMPRGTIEPEATYRSRLAAAWDLWPRAGTALGILLAARAAGYPSLLLQTQIGKQYQLASTLTGDSAHDLVISTMAGPVHLGGSPEGWQDFKALITKPWPSWWSGAPADGSADQKAFAALVKAWKSAQSRCVGIVVVDGPIVGLALTVGAFTVGSGASVTWTPPAG